MHSGSAGTVAARCSTRRRKKIQAAGGSRAASSPLPFLAGSDLQSTKNATGRLFLPSFTVFGSAFFSSPLDLLHCISVLLWVFRLPLRFGKLAEGGRVAADL